MASLKVSPFNDGFAALPPLETLSASLHSATFPFRDSEGVTLGAPKRGADPRPCGAEGFWNPFPLRLRLGYFPFQGQQGVLKNSFQSLALGGIHFHRPPAHSLPSKGVTSAKREVGRPKLPNPFGFLSVQSGFRSQERFMQEECSLTKFLFACQKEICEYPQTDNYTANTLRREG